MNRNFYCRFVILPEWEYADMKAVPVIRINLSRINNRSAGTEERLYSEAAGHSFAVYI